MKDATDLVQVFSYNLGLTKIEPHFAKFNYAEKVEYWAFMWGTVVMTVSGLLLWFNNFTLRYFPKWVSDAATAVHYYEALLATFSILLWHFYMVIFDPLVYPMDTAWLNGKVPADHYRHSRPEYFRALERAHLVELPTADLLMTPSSPALETPQRTDPPSKELGSEITAGGQPGPCRKTFLYAVIRDSKATRLGITSVEPLCWMRRCFLKPAKSRLTVSREVPIICPISS